MFRGHWLLPAAGITRMPPPDACSAVSVDVRFARAHTGEAWWGRTTTAFPLAPGQQPGPFPLRQRFIWPSLPAVNPGFHRIHVRKREPRFWQTATRRLITSRRRPSCRRYLASRASTPACSSGADRRTRTPMAVIPARFSGPGAYQFAYVGVYPRLSGVSAPWPLEQDAQCPLGRPFLPPLPQRTAEHILRRSMKQTPCPRPDLNRRHEKRSCQLSYKGI